MRNNDHKKLPLWSVLLGLLIFSISAKGEQDDTSYIYAAIEKALRQRDGDSPVKVILPKGRYYISSKEGVLLPSKIILEGDSSGETIIVNKPKGGRLFAITTTNPNEKYSYLSIARADDLEAHPPLPNGTYLGVNYVYLKNLRDIEILQSLGIPSDLSDSYGGMKAEIASGATLSNNSGNHDSSLGSSPKIQLEKDSQINPAPTNFNAILAVNSIGKVFLKEPNRLNWGADVHVANERLEDYYHPRASHSRSQMISGPAWLIPAHHYHHDIKIKNLIFETDTSAPDRLRYASGIHLAYCYNCEVTHCTFRKAPGFYHILAIRAFNISISQNQFDVYAEQSVCLDASSGITLAENKFDGRTWPKAAELGIAPSAINFINFDELPMDITIINNEFRNLSFQSSLKKKSGKAIFGTGGAYLKMVGNRFEGIARAILETSFFNDHVIIANNKIFNSTGWLGGSAKNLNIYDNHYDQISRVRDDGVATSFYNSISNLTNYFCNNRGITAEVWYSDTTYVASNFNQEGHPISSLKFIDVNGESGRCAETSHVETLSPIKIKSIVPSSFRLSVDTKASMIVALSETTPFPYPFFLIASAGDYNALRLKSFIVEIPAGQQSITLVDELTALKPGRVTVSAKPLASVSSQSASTELTILSNDK